MENSIEKITTNKQREAIKSFIEIELLKRGFTAKMAEFDEVRDRSGRQFINFRTEEFNTVPVIMKAIQVDTFGSWLLKMSEEDLEKLGFAEPTRDIYRCAINVHVSYEHFTGGTNGCELFKMHCYFEKDDYRVFDFNIK